MNSEQGLLSRLDFIETGNYKILLETVCDTRSTKMCRLAGCWAVLSLPLFHSAVCLTTGPKPLPKWALNIVRSRASSFKWHYPLLSLRSSSSSLRLLPRRPATSIPRFSFPSITCCRRHFLQMWPIQLAFRLIISCRIFLCSSILKQYFFIPHIIGPADLFHHSPAPHFLFRKYCLAELFCINNGAQTAVGRQRLLCFIHFLIISIMLYLINYHCHDAFNKLVHFLEYYL